MTTKDGVDKVKTPRPETHNILVGLIDNDTGEPLYYAEVSLIPSDLRKLLNVINLQLGYKGAMI
jgi:hypothetical protein